MLRFTTALAAVWLSSCPLSALAQDITAGGGQAQPVNMSATELFALADAARDASDYETAETAYRALAKDPDQELRTEARFRLAVMLADKQGKHRDAAVLLRQILDEKPDAARVRIELARMLAAMGNLRSAERELRAAQATGLPPEVEQLVRFYANALNAQKPFGGNLEFAVAPDSNINRATRSDTLGTIIGDFVLDEDAKEQSGIGLTARGQAYLRTAIDRRATLLAQASASGNFYRASKFDDYILSLQAGPQYASGRDRISVAGVTSWRWFGRSPYSFSYGLTGNWQHPLGKRGQLRIEGTAIHSDDRRSDLRDSDRYSAALGIDRAFSSRFGGGLQVSGYRDAARDPGYATAGGGIDGYLFREFGKTTAVLGAGYNHLEADERLFLYPRRRVDDRWEASLSATFRALRLGSFAPLAKLRFERNRSTVEIYDYQRLAGEIGVTAAF
jgi:outer membrane protein